MTDIKIATICGSLRRGSFNGALLRNACGLAPPGLVFANSPIADLPLYSSDLEAQGLPESARRLREQVRTADALLIATPEYNHSVPGGLKNALDWLSRPVADPIVVGRPVAIVSAGGRLGAARAQYHLRQICAAMGMLPMHRPELFVMQAWEKFDFAGRMTDEPTRVAFGELLVAFADWIKRINRATS